MRRRRRAAADADGALHRFSEPFPPHGALAAEGAANLLGRPRLDPLVVLVREAVQNSWDARRTDTGISFDVNLHHLDASAREALTTHVFIDLPRSAAALREVLQADGLALLTLRDGGTSGLGGPVRADRPAADGEPSNFVDLLFNIGQPADREARGGTYGFGRTIAFVVSKARAVVVYSRTEVGRRRESRLIAAAFTDHYTEGARRYTGRHWWGAGAADSIEPVVGDRADQLAASIGLAPFAGDATGTTIAVVGPDLRGRSPRQACNFLAAALTWNFWPKMLSHGDGPAVRFSVTCDGDPIAVPDPESTAPLSAFVASLRAVRATAAAPAPSATTLDDIVLPRTGEPLGRLAITRTSFERPPDADQGVDEAEERGTAAGFDGPAHHVALLREPELVVQYLPTAELTTSSEEYAGVFKPERTLDRAFAKAEPPTHDAWHPELVEETKLRRFVAVALRGVRALAERAARRSDAAAGAEVAAVAAALDELFTATPPAVSTRALSGLTVGLPVPSWSGNAVTSAIAFTVDPASDGTVVVIDASAHRGSHDGWTADRSATSEAQGVRVLGFSTADDPASIAVQGARLELSPDGPSDWFAFVRSPPDSAVVLDLARDGRRSRVSVLPHQTADRGVVASPWTVRGDDTVSLHSTVEVDPVAVRDACGLDPAAPLALVAWWHARGSNVRRVIARELVDGAGTHILEATLDRAEAAGEVVVERRLVLARAHRARSAVVASAAGAIVWREQPTDRLVVAMSRPSQRFVIDAVDFADHGLDPGAAWALDLRTDGLPRLTVNRAHPAIAQLVDSGDPERRRRVASVLRWDVARRVLDARLEPDDAIDGRDDVPPESIVGFADALLERGWPAVDIDTLRARRATDRAAYEAEVQGRLGFLEDA